MTDKILKQLNNLKDLDFMIDGELSTEIPTDFNEIFFFKQSTDCLIDGRERRFILKDYIMHDNNGYDFHKRYNDGIEPIDQVLYGQILSETNKMYYIDSHSIVSGKKWQGYIPKSAVVVEVVL